ncbi:MAG TPA: PIN domain-containing protein [Thermoanaerobaculia bacterium]
MARSRQVGFPTPRRLILHSGAVIALARRDQRALAFLARALELNVQIEIPVVVVAEVVRGGPRDAPVNRILKAVGLVPEAREVHARIAGELLGRARSTATIDALVVAHAVEVGGAHVLTGDREDLARLTASHPEVRIHAV